MHWERVRSLFDACLVLTPAARSEHLRRACGDDLALAEEVERLLQQDDVASEEQFLEWPNTQEAGITLSEPADCMIGTQLGKFRLLHRIAGGGSAVVYRAERMGQTQQEVAIKVLRSWQSDHEAFRRFQAEIQALADLSHPNIARMLDSDCAPDGSPYLVMELVHGGPIDEYCESNAVPLRQRIEWFHTICRTVAFAHGKGILHRDLKPANVLVTNDNRPVVTDFGLAKFLDDSRLNDPLHTATGAICGTPGYMAPEQTDLESGGISFGTDVYGLGAILYVLLTGQPPFRGDSIATTLRKLKFEEPLSPRKLAPSIPYDLDTICLKCLEKQPSQRYASAAQLADDVQRHLCGLPVVARPLSVTQRSARWVSRNRVLSALFLVVVGSLVSVTWLLALVARQRDIAEAKSHEARLTVDAMFTEVSKWLEEYPHTDQLRRKLLTRARQAYDRFSIVEGHDPQVLAEAATAAFRAGLIDSQLGQDLKAKAEVRDALRRFQELARRFPDKHEFQFDIFHCRFVLAEFDEAFRTVSDLCQRDPRPEYRDALAAAAASLGFQRYAAGDDVSARRIYRLGLEAAQKLVAEFPDEAKYRRHIGSNARGLSAVNQRERRFSEADELAKMALVVGRDLWEASPTDYGLATDYCESCRIAACSAFALGHVSRARELALTWTGVARQMESDHPDRPFGRIIEILEWLVQLELATGNLAAARQATIDLKTEWEAPRHRRLTEEMRRLQLALWYADNPFEDLRDSRSAAELLDSISPSSFGIGDWGAVGVVQLRCGRIEQAVESLKKASTADPISRRAYLALAYLMLGDEARSRAEFPRDNEWDESIPRHRVVKSQLRSEMAALQASE